MIADVVISMPDGAAWIIAAALIVYMLAEVLELVTAIVRRGWL